MVGRLCLQDVEHPGERRAFRSIRPARVSNQTGVLGGMESVEWPGASEQPGSLRVTRMAPSIQEDVAWSGERLESGIELNSQEGVE